MTPHRNPTRQGVTMIEILVTIVIVSILSIAVFLNMSGNVEDAKRATLTDFKSHAGTALKTWQAHVRMLSPATRRWTLGDWNYQSEEDIVVTLVPTHPYECMYWVGFLRGSMDGSLLHLPTLTGDWAILPPGNEWLSGYNSAADIARAIPGFDSTKIIIGRPAGSSGEFQIIELP